MATSTDLKQRAQTLASKTDINSIDPQEVGGLFYDLTGYAEDVQRNGGSLGIRKVYASVSAMEADSTSPKDMWGNPMRKGQLCVIYDGTTEGVDNNKVFAFKAPGWEIATQLDAGYATRGELAELEEKTLYGASSFSRVPIEDIFTYKNLLSNARYIKNASTTSDGFIENVKGQLAIEIPIKPNNYYIIYGFLPLYGFCVNCYNDSDIQIGDVIEPSYNKTTIKNEEWYSFFIPNDPSITKVRLTAYRSNNDDTNPIPYDSNKAIITNFIDLYTLPKDCINKDFLENISNNIDGLQDTISSVQRKIVENIDKSGERIGFLDAKGTINTTYDTYRVVDFNIDDSSNTFVATSSFSGSGDIYFLYFFNQEGILLGAENKISNGQMTNYEFNVPAETAIISINSSVNKYVTLGYISKAFIKSSDLLEAVTDDSADSVIVDYSSYEDGFLNTNGEIVTKYPGYKVYWFTSVEESKDYYLTNKLGGTGVYHITVYNSENTVIDNLFLNTNNTELIDEPFTMPAGSYKIGVSSNSGEPILRQDKADEIIYSKDLKKRIYALENSLKNSKRMKVTIDSDGFYIRSKFDDSRDMIMHYFVNKSDGNTNISPDRSYIGDKDLTNGQIINNGYCHYMYDSTAPFYTQNYWYIFGEHGYYIAKINTEHDKSVEDIGSIWKDTNNTEFILVSVSDGYLVLAPVITKNGGGDGKDTRGFNYGGSITDLTHVSGATNTNDIVISSFSGLQWKPITQDVKKVFYADGVEITDYGDYYCDEFIAIDEHNGLNPITITEWSPISADPLVQLIFSWRFSGLNVFCQNTIKTLYPIWLNYYGAFQPMGLRAWNGMSPMIAIPKVKEFTAEGKITVDWKFPQNCNTPNQNWAKTSFKNISTDLIQVDNMPERIVEFHRSESEHNYGIGFAAGYSLISGMTINEKRKNMTLTCFQFTQDERNKLYIRCLDYEKIDNQVLPAGSVYQFNYYYSYFDPSQGDAMSYVYKDGSKWLVYVHCWSEVENGIIVLPDYLNGFNVSDIIEKTDGIELLTDSITDKRLIFNSNNNANYIVFKVE